MSTQADENQAPALGVDEQFQDLVQFARLGKLKRQEMFTDDFKDFMKWFKAYVHERYQKKDFERIQRGGDSG